MTNIVLDTNIILRYPKVLGLQIPDTHFIVPIDVIEELNYSGNQRGNPFYKSGLIDKASHQGTISIVNSDAPGFRKYRLDLASSNLSASEVGIVSVALGLRDKADAVFLATLDRDLWNVAQERGVGIISETEMDSLLANFAKPSPNSSSATDSIQEKIITYESKEKNSFIRQVLVGAIVNVLLTTVFVNLKSITSTINIWGTVLLILISGFALFVFREKQRLSYGIFELLVGVVAIIMLFLPKHFDFSALTFNVDFNIKLLGGLYIMVRGQDNIIKALKDTKIGIIIKDKYGIG